MAIDLERALLRKITDTAALRECWDRGLRNTAFEDPFCAGVFDFAVEYWVRNGMATAPSEEVLLTEFDPEGKGRLQLESTDESLHWLVDKLIERQRSNRVQTLLLDAAKVSDRPQEALDILFQGAWDAKEQTSPRSARVDLADNADERLEAYRRKSEQPEQARGAPVGLAEVDEHTGGILPGELAVVAAYTKTGKSFALIQAAVEAHKQGYRPYIASLEQPVPEFQERIDALYSGVGYGRIQRGNLTEEDFERLQEAMQDLRDGGPFKVERLEEGERKVSTIVNRARQLDCNYLIIDQLDWMEPSGRHRDSRDAYKELIYGLKNEIGRASSGSIPCYMAVQFNRQSVSGESGQRGQMHHIAEASHIERTVDLAFGLFRTQEMRTNNSMVLDMIGSRRSDIKSWLLGWYLNSRSEIFVREEYRG